MPTSPDEDFFMFQHDRWQCTVCGQLNDDDADVCFRCGADRPPTDSA